MSNNTCTEANLLPSSSAPCLSSLGSATDSDLSALNYAPDTRLSRQSESEWDEEERRCEYPLANSTSLIEVIRDDEDHIDIEAEEEAYRAFDLDDSDSSAFDLSLSSRNSRPRLPTLTRTPSRSIKVQNRPPSSIFSHDIWVGENGDAEKDTSFSRGVRIVGWTSVGDKRGGAYVVYDCAILTHALTTIHIHKRFSAFLSLHTTLISSSSPLCLPAHVRKHVPPLPPRTALARFRPGFLEGRRRALQSWLTAVLLHPEIGGCKAVREWVMA